MPSSNKAETFKYQNNGCPLPLESHEIHCALSCTLLYLLADVFRNKLDCMNCKRYFSMSRDEWRTVLMYNNSETLSEDPTTRSVVECGSYTSTVSTRYTARRTTSRQIGQLLARYKNSTAAAAASVHITLSDYWQLFCTLTTVLVTDNLILAQLKVKNCACE